jgi:hypothetical protein
MNTNLIRLFTTLVMAVLLNHALTAHANAAPLREQGAPTLNATTTERGTEWPTPASYALLLLGLGVMEALAQKRRK